MLKSSGAMGIATLSSRFLGLAREMAYAHFMGTGPVASAFTMAFLIPNLFRRLLGEGALTAAFIPIFKEKEKTEGEAEMWRAANAVISGLIIAATTIIALAMAGITLWLAFRPVSGETRLMLQLLRWMFPYMLLVCLAAVFMGILNARGYFFIPAMGATMLNVVMVASVFLLAPRMGYGLDRQIFGLAIGVLIAGVAQAAFQWPSMRREGFRYRWVSPWANETVREVLHKMVPGTIGVAAFQINVMITWGVAFMIDAPIIPAFNYAVRLMELPQGVFGISLATYLLPTLSGLSAEKKFPEFRATLRQGLQHLLFANFIASALLVSLARPIIRLLFERGIFDAYSTDQTAWALVCLGPGLVAFSVVNNLARAFYALGDTKTPMKISLVCLGLNLIFALWLIGPFRQGGLGIANTMSAAFNVYLLLYALRRKLGRLDLEALRPTVWGLAAAAILAGVVASLASYGWERQIGHHNLVTRMGSVFAPMILATAAYWLVALWLRIPSAQEILALLRSKLGGREK